jgi:formyltetrahydrofolate deformylase
MRTFRLVVSCPDRTGIVAAVASYVAGLGGSLIESSQHTDVAGAWFFLRNEIDFGAADCSIEEFRSGFEPIANEFDMQWYVRDSLVPQKVVILASKASHCLTELLYRWKAGELYCEIPCIISNHENLRSLVEWHGIPFHHVPVPKEGKGAAFQKTNDIIERHGADCVVLARYMQILPPDLCRTYAGRVINIHHSFLPSFIGADPYQKAFDRGVKLIGATSHYVTEDLDEGPIIEQDVIRVNHSCDRKDMIRLGRDVERAVLSRGLLFHLQDRVIIHGNKTVVFT